MTEILDSQTGNGMSEAELQSLLILKKRLLLIDFASTHTLQEILQFVLDEVCSFVDSPIGFYHFLLPDEETIVIQAWSTTTVKEFCTLAPTGVHYNIAEAGVWSDCIKQRRAIIHNDYKSLKQKSGLPDGHVDLIRELVVPIFHADKIVAILGVGNKPVEYTDFDKEVVRFLAEVSWEIVEQKKNREELVEREERFRAMFINAPLSFQSLNEEGFIIDVNPMWLNTLGYAQEEVLGKWFGDFLEADQVEDFRNNFARFKKLGNVHDVRFSMRKKSGERVVVSFEGCVGYHSDGRFKQTYCVFKDITTQHAVTEKLKESIDNWNNTFDAIQDGIAIIDSKQMIVRSNLAFQEIVRSMPMELNGKHCFRFVHKSLEPDEDCPFIEMRETLKRSLAEVTVNGRLYEVMVDPVFNARGELNGAVHIMKDITERKETEKSLQRHASLLTGIFDFMPSGAAIYEVLNDGSCGYDYIVRHFNKRSLEIEQLTLNEVIGKNLKELRPAIDEFGLIPIFKKVWDTGEPSYFPSTAYVDEKFNNYYENYVFKIPTGEIVAIYNDVTGRQKVEDALKQSEERYNLAMMASRDGLFDWDLETNAIYYSPSWKSMLGYSESELPDDFSVWETLTHPEDVKASWKMLNEVLNRKRDRFELTFRMKHKNGKWIDILSRANVYFNEEDKATRVVGTHTDISEQVRTQKILQIQYTVARDVVQAPDLEHLLQTVQLELNTIMDAKNFILAMYDPGTDRFNKIIFNDEYDDFQEWHARHSLSGVVVKEKRTVLLKRAEIEELAMLHNLDLQGTPAQCWLGVPITCADEIYGAMVIQSYTDPMAYDNDCVILLEVIANEISTFLSNQKSRNEILRLKESLEQRVAQRTLELENAYREMEAFSYSVSHDLRAPVRAILGFTQILMEDNAGRLSQESERVCNVIRDNAARMGQLIDDLLSFSRLSRTELNMMKVNMKDLAGMVFHELVPADKRQSIHFHVDNICQVYADPVLMKIVWTNLLSNAVKYSSKVDRPVITVSCEMKDDRCIFRVSDNGSGFDMKYHDKLFGVFQRLHNVKEFEGTGVGLAMVKRIITYHGGETWAEGEPGKGATFYFTLTGIPEKLQV